MQTPVIQPISRQIAGRCYSVAVAFADSADGLTCSVQDAQAAELVIAAAVAEGPPSSEGFAFLRKALGLTAVKLAQLLDVRSETISRWENGASTFDRATWLALGSLVLERSGRQTSPLERLQRLAAGTQAPTHQQLELAKT